MKEVFAITQKRGDELIEFPHVLFGVNKDDLRNATRFTDARIKIKWNNDFEWGLMCDDETYLWLLEHLVFGGFDPYEIPDASEIYLKEMKRKNIRFYKEIIMV
jgi:hypothetical protein